MKKIFCLMLVFVMAIPVFAEFKVKITGTPPTTGDSTIDSYLETAFKNVINDLNREFTDFFPNSPDKLLRAMSNSSVYANHGATTRGYGGYKLFSATIGPMFGFQLPTDLASFIDSPLDMEALDDNGDINLGISPNMVNVNAGISLGILKFLPENFGALKRDNFYVGLRIGYFRLPSSFEEFSYNSFTLGITANYQVIPSVNLVKLIKWRGLNVGTGFIYSGAKTSIVVPLGNTIYQNIQGTSNGRIELDPKASIGLDTKTFTIPLEAVTAIKLLIFNIHAGVGADISFGKTSLGLEVASPIKVTGAPFEITNNGSFSVNAEAGNSPTVFNFKVMSGYGISAGPVVFDIPVTFYPLTKGYSVGITVGAVY